MPKIRESDLYQPLKSFLESQGYSVKSEISNCDVVAVRGDDELVIVELKTSFTLPLVFQGIQRQSMTDHVYLAFAVHTDRSGITIWRRHHREICSAPGSLDTSLSHAAGLIEIAACHA